MFNTKVTYITPIGSTAIIGFKPERSGEYKDIASVVCRNWRGLNVGDSIQVELFAGIPKIVFQQ